MDAKKIIENIARAEKFLNEEASGLTHFDENRVIQSIVRMYEQLKEMEGE